LNIHEDDNVNFCLIREIGIRTYTLSPYRPNNDCGDSEGETRLVVISLEAGSVLDDKHLLIVEDRDRRDRDVLVGGTISEDVVEVMAAMLVI
jgi:hypothetical protein